MEQDLDGAINYLVEYNKEVPSIRLECIIGDLYADKFNDSLATKYYNMALKQNPTYSPALYGLTEIYRKKNDFNNYFSSLNKVFANGESPAEIKIEYLKQLFQSTNYINTFSNQIDTLMLTLDKTHPKDSTATLITAAYFAQKQDYNKSAELLKKNYNNYPDSFSSLVQYVAFFYQREDWTNLEIAAKEGLEKYPDNIDFIQLIGISQFRREMYNEAKQTYKQLEDIALKKKDTLLLISSYSLLGDLAHELKNNKEAYSYYKKALKYNPNEAAVLNNYAYYLSEENKNLKKAYKMSKKSVELEPDNPTYLDTFGWILFLMDKPIEAKAQFKHAMLYGGKESAVILDHYAEVLFRLKEYDLAFIYWEQADRMDGTLGIKEKIIQRKKEKNKE
jgi:Flp pilus assembly protein TadD, contains TPR repeats